MAIIQRNWLLGKRIADEELRGENRAEYGIGVRLSMRFGVLGHLTGI